MVYPRALFPLAAFLFLLSFCLSLSAGATNDCWFEAEYPKTINFNAKPEGAARPHFLSGQQWLRISVEKDHVEKEVPDQGILLDYDLEIPSQGDRELEIWNRVGFEFARSPFEWRLDQGPWKLVSPEELTFDCMELSFWCEVAWLKLGVARLSPGAHRLSIRLPKTKNAQGQWERILYASDAFCFTPPGSPPYSFHLPAGNRPTARDREAERHVFQMPEAQTSNERVVLKLAGLWQVCRHDEQYPGEVAAPITNFPAAPLWTAIPVPSDKNQREDLIFAHRLWYRTRVHVPSSLANRSFFLVFPQNNLNTTVYVNGQFCGFDKNPFARVQIDLGRAIRPGENEVWVGIKDAWYGYSSNPNDPLKLRKKFNLPLRFFSEGFQDLAYPIWDHPQSGILAAPELVAAGSAYAADVFCQPSVSRQELTLDLTLKNPESRPVSGDMMIEVISAASGQVEKRFPAKAFSLAPGREEVFRLVESWENPRLWWPDDPHLYQARAIIKPQDTSLVPDLSATTFGFREWTATGPDFRLNGIKWHGWADCFTAASPEEWIKFYRASQQTTMRFWGTRWLGLPPEEALSFFDQQGVVCRRSGLLDGQRIGNMAVENDPGLQKLHGTKIKAELMLNWFDQMVAQVKGERNHPSINLWSLENEWLYINCLNLYGGMMDEFEAWVTRASQAVRAADPTRLTMTDGGGANRDQSMPVHGNHYVFDSGDGVGRYPALAYEPNPQGGGRGRWTWDERRPRFLGEDYFANGINPFDYAYFGGEAAFQGKAQAYPAAGLIYRILTQGYRWAGYGAWHFWMSQHQARDQYRYNAPRVILIKEWDWTFASGQNVARTIRLFNDTRYDHPITLVRSLTLAGRPIFSKTSTHSVPPGESSQWVETLAMPSLSDSRAEGELKLALLVDGQEVFRDAKEVSLLNIRPTGSPSPASGETIDSSKSSLVVYDPQGPVAAFLQEHRLDHLVLSNLDLLPDLARFLIIGPQALDAREAASSRLAAWASAGRRVLVLEQDHPLKYQALPCDMNASLNEGRTAFIEDTAHPAMAGLKDKDFFTWSADQVVYRHAYEKPARGAKSLIQCDRRLARTALAEAPVGDGHGLLLLNQLLIGAKLPTNAVAQKLFLNLVDYAARYQRETRSVAAVVASDPLLSQTLEAIGLVHTKTDHPLAALESHRIVLASATTKNLNQLVAGQGRVEQFMNQGGVLVLHGLTPEGLPLYNQLAGFEHMIRKFGRERVSLANPRHPLTAGLTLADVVLRSGERIFGWTSDEYVAGDLFSYILDYRDVAPFARFENDFKKLLVNGMVSADAWKYIVNLPVDQCVFKLAWPKPQTFESMTWVGNTLYWPATQAEFIFDQGSPLLLDLAPHQDPQDLEFVPPQTARQLVFRITRFNEIPGKNAVSGLDNLSLYARRPAEFLDSVKPLVNIGGLMFYQRGQGGLLLCNLLFKESEAVPENALKKRTILSTMLRNLKAPFGGQRSIIAGARHRYAPVDISRHATAYRNERGWFGDPRFTFAALPSGRQTFAGVPFQIFEFETSPVPTVILLHGPGLPGNLPKEVRGLPLAGKADALFFLHTMKLDRPLSPEDLRKNKRYETLRYQVTYADGRTEIIPIFAEIDIHHYRQKSPAAIPGAQIGWTRPYENSEDSAVAYVKQWNNPHPGLELKSLDILPGSSSRGAPALLAVTVATTE